MLTPPALWRRWQWHPTPVLLPGKSLGQRSLVGYSPWGLEEADTTERLPFHFSLSCIGEGNGNPLPCSCLENPRDGGAWWAAIYGVAQSRTQLKWLSSSSKAEWSAHNWEYENEFKTCSFWPCVAHSLKKGEGHLKKEVQYNLLSTFVELYTDWYEDMVQFLRNVF